MIRVASIDIVGGLKGNCRDVFSRMVSSVFDVRIEKLAGPENHSTAKSRT